MNKKPVFNLFFMQYAILLLTIKRTKNSNDTKFLSMSNAMKPFRSWDDKKKSIKNEKISVRPNDITYLRILLWQSYKKKVLSWLAT